MNRTSNVFRASAAAAALALGIVMLPTSANAITIGGGAPAGQAAQEPVQGGGAQTAGLLDWYFCMRHGKKSPC